MILAWPFKTCRFSFKTAKNWSNMPSYKQKRPISYIMTNLLTWGSVTNYPCPKSPQFTLVLLDWSAMYISIKFGVTSSVTGKLIGIKLLNKMKNVRKVKPKFWGFKPAKENVCQSKSRVFWGMFSCFLSNTYASRVIEVTGIVVRAIFHCAEGPVSRYACAHF